MDTGDRSTLLAADRSVGEVAAFLEVDSLAYLELDQVLDAAADSDPDRAASFCTACLSGDYPTDVTGAGDKHMLERP